MIIMKFEINERELIQAALEARENAYAPYSGFRVGAALLCENGKVYKGCNVENAAFSPTVCAERTALFSAVADGERKFIAIAIVGGKGDEIDPSTAPCGVCRQVLCEFCDEDFRVILGLPKDFRMIRLGELLPHAFSSKNLT